MCSQDLPPLLLLQKVESSESFQRYGVGVCVNQNKDWFNVSFPFFLYLPSSFNIMLKKNYKIFICGIIGCIHDYSRNRLKFAILHVA